jgi:ribosome-binding protein aMBF1 (putative translation factor)
MAKVKYIDPVFQETLEQINPAIRKEVGLSFDIAKRITDVMAEKHWNQVDLAKATGKKASLVSRWLSGTHNFTIQTIVQIECALGASVISISKTRGKKARLL